MKNEKNEQNQSTKTNSSSGYGEFPGYNWKKGILAVADFGAVVSSTAVLITIVQSPLKSIAMNLTKNGRFFEHEKSWSYPAVAALYRGSVAALTGGIVRSTYVIGSKNVVEKEGLMVKSSAAREVGSVENTHHEEVMKIRKDNAKINIAERKVGLREQLPSVALITVGDVIVTQISETKAQLAKAGIPSQSYKWHTFPNLATISKLGVVSRFSGSMINFTSVCIITDFYAKYIPGENKTVKQTLGGMLSGVTAALVSFPFSYYRDYLITKVTHSEGKLIAPGAKQVIYNALKSIKQMNKAELMSNAKSIAKNAAVRSVTTAATFGVVAGVSSLLGSEPVTGIVDKLANNSLTEKYKIKLEEIKEDSSTEASNNVEKNIKK